MTTIEDRFRGRLKALSIADILAFLCGLNRTGLLSVSGEGAAIGLYLRGPSLVHATSTRDADRLSDLLLRWGLLSPSQQAQVMQAAAAGMRIGKALVSSGVLSPRGLIDVRVRQARQIALSLFEWHDGEFVFREGEEPEGETLLIELPLLDIVVEGIRSVQTLALFRERLPSAEWVFETNTVPEGHGRAVQLEPQEEYLLGLVDGKRSVGEIVEASEFPDLETRRILFLLFTVGRVRPHIEPGSVVGDAPLPRQLDEIVIQFNRMYGSIYRYLTRELGPISDTLLARSLRDTQGAHPVLFSRASLGGDGTLNAAILQDNLKGLNEARKQETIVQGLNELLYSELLMLRRTLGTDHERRFLKTLRGDRSLVGLGLESAG